MPLSRRALAVAAATLPLATAASSIHAQPKVNAMYGLIGKMKCTPGQRDALIAALLEGTSDMPGCLSYLIAKDPSDADAIWITEAWESQAKHKESLALPAVQAAIKKARPIIAGFGERFETEPVGGHGLVTSKRAS
jgi:quinol monooxygenase YgiN